jgi:hypothetical protein
VKIERKFKRGYLIGTIYAFSSRPTNYAGTHFELRLQRIFNGTSLVEFSVSLPNLILTRTINLTRYEGYHADDNLYVIKFAQLTIAHGTLEP